MSGITNITESQNMALHFDGEPDYTFRFFFKGDAFVFDHANVLDISVAIKKVEGAIQKLKKEFCIDDESAPKKT